MSKILLVIIMVVSIVNDYSLNVLCFFQVHCKLVCIVWVKYYMCTLMLGYEIAFIRGKTKVRNPVAARVPRMVVTVLST